MMSISPLSPYPNPVLGYGTGWLVVEKPSGVSVHNDPGDDLCTHWNAYLQSDKKLARMLAYDPGYGLHAVHRLDKETSGIILLACRRAVFKNLAAQFSQGAILKEYLALVHRGASQGQGRGLWQWPLTPKAAGRRNIQGNSKRSPSQTRYRVVQISAHYALVACTPLTGRTHQIRRHAALAGRPVVGDRRYGSLRACRYVADHHGFVRLALHAAGLSFTPPESMELQRFESSGLPADMQALINCDRLVDSEGRR